RHCSPPSRRRHVGGAGSVFHSPLDTRRRRRTRRVRAQAVPGTRLEKAGRPTPRTTPPKVHLGPPDPFRRGPRTLPRSGTVEGTQGFARDPRDIRAHREGAPSPRPVVQTPVPHLWVHLTPPAPPFLRAAFRLWSAAPRSPIMFQPQMGLGKLSRSRAGWAAYILLLATHSGLAADSTSDSSEGIRAAWKAWRSAAEGSDAASAAQALQKLLALKEDLAIQDFDAFGAAVMRAADARLERSDSSGALALAK